MYMQSDASPFFRIFSFFWGWTHSTWVQVLGIDLDEFVTGCMQLHGPAKPLVVRYPEPTWAPTSPIKYTYVYIYICVCVCFLVGKTFEQTCPKDLGR